MRRQARISGGGALVVRSASALQVWLWLLIFIFQNEFRISRSIQPGYLDFDNLPDTNFTCAGKVIGGYYADLETSCQMFHVCTVGPQDDPQPMDIKFLCLNGTVFDQETRVCERVDEVDCTKSEKFYSLNLELYGSSTAPPTIQPDQQKPQAQPTEQSQKQTKPTHKPESDPTVDDSLPTSHDKTQGHSQDVPDSTEDPIQEIKKDEPKNPHAISPTHPPLPFEENEELTEEYQEDDIDGEYEDYSHPTTTTTTKKPVTTTRITTTTTTTTKPPPTTRIMLPTSSHYGSSIPHYSSPSPILSSLSPPVPSPYAPSTIGPSSSLPSAPSAPALPTLDPSLLSPQEFIYRHRGPSSEAISYQHQSFRPADRVYITHAPPQQFDHFQYESSRTAPRPSVPRPAAFVQRPQPTPFRATTLDPRDQLLRPGPTSQPSERHETSVKHRTQNFPTPVQFNTFYFDRKRSEDAIPETESSLSARSVAPPTVTERPPIKFKSPPRVIVTASASVSDSNGKRLNYTVGNVVSAVKPIVPINYDDYKESDLIFDPFFLDVPKLQKRRKTRSNKNSQVFTFPATATISTSTDSLSDKTQVTTSPVTSRATTTESIPTTVTITTTTAAWNPNDYVDDNYEPHAYIPPVPPLAILVPHELNKYKQQERQLINELFEKRTHRDNILVKDTAHSKPTSSSAAQTTSSQSVGAGSVPPAASPSPPRPPPLEAPACVNTPSSDCRTRA